MVRILRIGIGLGAALLALGLAADASAQLSTADAKRTLRGQKLFYKEPGMIEVDVRAMRQTLMLTGSVPNEERRAKASELADLIRGIRDIRNRLRVRAPDVAAGEVDDAILREKIQKKIEEDEDLLKAQVRERFTFTLEDGNVTIEGKLRDWSEADSLIGGIRQIPGIQTIDFDKLRY